MKFMNTVRRAIVSGLVALMPALFVLGCEKGPDRAQEAAAFKADVEQQLQVVERDWAGGRISHESFSVDPVEGAPTYLVTIKAMSFTPEPGAKLSIGDVSYLLTPKDEKTFAVSDLKMPGEMPFSGPDGATGKLAMNVKSLSGLWSRDIKTFLKFDSEIADIVATDSRGGDIRIQSAKLNGDSADKGNGVFDMTGLVQLTGASAIEETGGKLVLGEMKVDAKYGSVKIKEYLEAVGRIQALTAPQVAAAESGGTPPALSPEDQKTLSAQMMIVASSIKDADWQLNLSNLAFEESGGAKPFSLAKLGFSASITGADADKSQLSLSASHSGLAIDAPEANTPLARAVLPKEGSLKIKITDIPTKSLSQAISEQLPGAIGSGAPIETGLMQLGFVLQSVLAHSGAKITIEPSGWSGEVTRIEADGAFDVDANAIFGAVGTLNLALHGLDELLSLAQANPDLTESQQVLGMGQMLSAMAKRENGADGKPVDRFKIDIDQQGQMLINGKPMGM
jgi:hypothetical protein